jgi:hypothetical protein
MIRSTTFRLTFTWEDEVDVVIRKDDGKIKSFSVNYRTRIDDKWCDVIRYDTAHGKIHVHKFWISTKIIALKGVTEMKTAVIDAVRDMKSNWSVYKNNLIEKVKRNGK